MCIIGREKKCIKMFTELASAIWDKRQMYFLLLQKFLHDFCEQLFNACFLYLTYLEMDKETIFPPSGHYHSQPFYHSHLFWSEVITLTIQTEGPNTRGWKGALTSNHKIRKTGLPLAN